MQSEGKRFVTALEKRCQLMGSSEVSVAQLHALGSKINLTVPDIDAFIDQLNEAGTTVPSSLCMSHPVFQSRHFSRNNILALRSRQGQPSFRALTHLGTQ